MLAGVTPEIDQQHAVFQALGERFTRVRWPRPEGVPAGLKAIRQTEQVKHDLKVAAKALLEPVLARTHPAPAINAEQASAIAHFSEIAALARAHVPRERGTHDIIDEPAPEGNTRLPQQLAQIGRGCAVLHGSQEVRDCCIRLAARAARDCLPPVRRKVLQQIIGGANAYVLDIPQAVLSRAIEDLEAVGLVRKDRPNSTAQLSEKGLALLAGTAGLMFPQSAC